MPIPGLERTRNIKSRQLRIPAEWEFQEKLLLVWPHKNHGWSDIKEIEPVYIQLVSIVSEYQSVLVICMDNDHQNRIDELWDQTTSKNIATVIAATNDCWIRDTGPVSIIDGTHTKYLNFKFNGWGNKYPYTLDDQLNKTLDKKNAFSNPMKEIPIILEGGSIESNGQGTVMTTSSCLLSPSRNNYSKNKIEEILLRKMGVHKILWLNHGIITGDDTDGHIDTLARFCSENTIVYSVCNNKNDSNYEKLKLMEQELTTICEHNTFNLIPVNLPSPVLNQSNQQLPATYTNFQISNDVVLCPLYDDPMDNEALSTLKMLFPNHQVTGVNSLPLIEQNGSLHCCCLQLH